MDQPATNCSSEADSYGHDAGLADSSGHGAGDELEEPARIHKLPERSRSHADRVLSANLMSVSTILACQDSPRHSTQLDS